MSTMPMIPMKATGADAGDDDDDSDDGDEWPLRCRAPGDHSDASMILEHACVMRENVGFMGRVPWCQS